VKLAEFITSKMLRTTVAAEPEQGPIKVTLNLGGHTSEEQEANRVNDGRAVAPLMSR
jgi:hypothetical protein